MTTETNEKPTSERLLEQAIQHLETRWQYFSLSATEKVSEAASTLVSVLAVAFFALIMFFFFSVGFAFWLSERLGSRAAGFSLTGLVFLPAALAAFYFVKPWVRSKIIQNILDNDDEQDGR